MQIIESYKSSRDSVREILEVKILEEVWSVLKISVACSFDFMKARIEYVDASTFKRDRYSYFNRREATHSTRLQKQPAGMYPDLHTRLCANYLINVSVGRLIAKDLWLLYLIPDIMRWDLFALEHWSATSPSRTNISQGDKCPPSENVFNRLYPHKPHFQSPGAIFTWSDCLEVTKHQPATTLRLFDDMYFAPSNLSPTRWFFLCSSSLRRGKRRDTLTVSWTCDLGFLTSFGAREWFAKVYGSNDFLLFSPTSCISDLQCFALEEAVPCQGKIESNSQDSLSLLRISMSLIFCSPD